MHADSISQTKASSIDILKDILNSPSKQVTLEGLCEQGLSKKEATTLLEMAKTLVPLCENAAVLRTEMVTSSQQTMHLIKELKQSLIDNVKGTLRAFNRVILIYTVAFIIGTLLIITGVVFAAMGKTVLAIAFGTIGLIDMLTYFFKMPASKIQESRSNLSQLQVVLLVWMKDFVNNDALSSALLNVKDPVVENYRILSQINIHNTEKLLNLIQDLAEPKE